MTATAIIEEQKRVFQETEYFRAGFREKPYQTCIERYFFKRYTEDGMTSQFVYLPIAWFDMTYRYGSDQRSREYLEHMSPLVDKFVQTLIPEFTYFTIVHAGPIESLWHCLLKIKQLTVYASSGPVLWPETSLRRQMEYIPLPLMSDRVPSGIPERERDVFASFYGGITHPIREKMIHVVEHLPEFMTGGHKPKQEYFQMMRRSVFSLSPRGANPSSLRMYEAMQLGSIPVYVNNEIFLPYRHLLDWSELCVTVHESELVDLPKILHCISLERIRRMQEAIGRFEAEFLHHERTYQEILTSLAEKAKG